MPADRQLVIETVVLVLVGWLRLRLRRNRAITALGQSVLVMPVASSSPATEARVRWAVGVVGRNVPVARNCLVQAMAAQALLWRRGSASRVVLGVAHAGDGQLTAHAWVENAVGHVVVGSCKASSYSPLAVGHADAS